MQNTYFYNKFVSSKIDIGSSTFMDKHYSRQNTLNIDNISISSIYKCVSE